MSTEFVIEVHNLKTENDNILKDTIRKVFKNKLEIDISVDKLDIEDCGDTKLLLVQSKRPVNVYVKDENIGNETRYREFKEGGGNIDNFLRTENTKSLAHYACGFVNNQKDGIIFIGVDDDGKVLGVKYDHGKRDRIRTQISRIMKYDIKPPLSTIHYSITFAPVRTEEGENQEEFGRDGRTDTPITVYPTPVIESIKIIRHKQTNDELQEKLTKYEVDKAKNEHIIAEEKRLREEKEKEISSLKREKSKLVKENKTLKDKSKCGGSSADIWTVQRRRYDSNIDKQFDMASAIGYWLGKFLTENMTTEFVIEVNNLKRENDTILKQAIQNVFKKLNVDISVDALDIEDCGDTKSALIYLQSIDEINEVTDIINNNGFKFT
ncbi:unnamed protein product [Mytilus coruscus]|uniref:Schlafen AlbA-2 domain-containing protein n=1 Tax=Mytilus coruscus TaxID=42192 RepID=A0A6J8EFV7_MYTCO|nr:unnamed protein product [Mytilus coruscus]